MSVAYTLAAPVVRIPMSATEGEALAPLLVEWPQDVRDQVSTQLWLLAVFTEQRRRTNIAERPAFDERCNRILEMLDPEPSS